MRRQASVRDHTHKWILIAQGKTERFRPHVSITLGELRSLQQLVPTLTGMHLEKAVVGHVGASAHH